MTSIRSSRNKGTNKLFKGETLKHSDMCDIRNQIEWLEMENERLEKIKDAALKYIEESPCDPDIFEKQMVAWNELQNLIKENNNG